LDNPAGFVPSLKVGDHTVTESFAIMQFLEEQYPSTPSLLPTDVFDRAAVRSLALHIIAGIQPIQNMVVLKYIGKDKSQEWAQHWIKEGFKSNLNCLFIEGRLLQQIVPLSMHSE
jgi:maleylacetoacetate isomerase